MIAPHRFPIQIPLPIVDKPTGKLDASRKPELVTVFAKLLLLAVRPEPNRPSEPNEVGDEAR